MRYYKRYAAKLNAILTVIFEIKWHQYHDLRQDKDMWKYSSYGALKEKVNRNENYIDIFNRAIMFDGKLYNESKLEDMGIYPRFDKFKNIHNIPNSGKYQYYTNEDSSTLESFVDDSIEYINWANGNNENYYATIVAMDKESKDVLAESISETFSFSESSQGWHDKLDKKKVAVEKYLVESMIEDINRDYLFDPEWDDPENTDKYTTVDFELPS